jgi:hypothetical protein
MECLTRRRFLQQSSLAVAGAAAAGSTLFAQVPGERPPRSPDVTVVNPRNRVPIGLIIDDSTCLVNLNRFAIPQFDQAFGGKNPTYHRQWRAWPEEIPDSFVRKFGEWCAENGVKGKYSVVPYPACVGRIDRILPGWTQRELDESIKLVRELMMPNWDIHPEMVTHTRVIDVKTGHPYEEFSLKYMENWDWTTGRSASEIAEYIAYSLRILKNVGLNCEGVTTPGGFGNRALPELSQATLEAVRDVFGAEIPHYFRHLYDEGDESVAPRVEYVSGLGGPNPRCVVSIIGCTGDWTGGWDNSIPVGADAFITPDLQKGRMVDVIERGEPALMVCHWTGIHWNGEEFGFKVFQEVVRRLKARFDHLVWMKLSEVSRYWAAKELTRIGVQANAVVFDAPFACPSFTARIKGRRLNPRFIADGKTIPLREVSGALQLESSTFVTDGDGLMVCADLPAGISNLEFNS